MTPTSTSAARVSTSTIWVGRVLSGLAVLFFVLDGVMKVLQLPPSIDATVGQLGYPQSAVMGIGITLLVCTLLYVIPRTSGLGAILLTAYLGGAVASNVRIGAPLFNVMFPIIFAAFVWAGLALRDVRWKEMLLSMP